MSITREQVHKVAELARLTLSPVEEEKVQVSLSNILDLIEQLQSVDTTGLEPLVHPLDASQRLREDIVTEKDQRALLQASTTHVTEGLYIVPQVIEEE